MKDKYHSFGGSRTVKEAIENLGRNHVQWLIGDWHNRLNGRIRGTWAANMLQEHSDYCALMQAGFWVVASAVDMICPFCGDPTDTEGLLCDSCNENRTLIRQVAHYRDKAERFEKVQKLLAA